MHRQDPARHAEDKQNTETHGTKNEDGTRQERQHRKWEHKSGEDRFLERKVAQDNLSKDVEAGSKRATCMDTTVLFMDKDPTEELPTFYESLFNVKEEGRELTSGTTLGQTIARARQTKSQMFYKKSTY